jgi:hypothetical protein
MNIKNLVISNISRYDEPLIIKEDPIKRFLVTDATNIGPDLSLIISDSNNCPTVAEQVLTKFKSEAKDTFMMKLEFIGYLNFTNVTISKIFDISNKISKNY